MRRLWRPYGATIDTLMTSWYYVVGFGQNFDFKRRIEMSGKQEHFLFTDFGDVFLGKTTDELKKGEVIKIKGITYKVVGDSGDLRKFHEIYLSEA